MSLFPFQFGFPKACILISFFLLHLAHPKRQLGPNKVHFVRTRGGNTKKRALKLDHGNFAWGSEKSTRKAKIIDVVYNASNNELVRTKILVKNTIVVVDATPFRLWYETYYRLPLPVKTKEVSSVCCSLFAGQPQKHRLPDEQPFTPSFD